jgi:tungstate transport system substrate-binding protein
MTKIAVVALIAIIGIAVGAYAYIEATKPQNQHLIVSTTTSFYETGFLDVVKAHFEAKYPYINVSFISQGTGLAIQTAMRGDADMIMVHDPAQELKFLQDGYGVNRKVIAYNFFVIVGPNDDPAGITGLSPIDALKKIKEYGDAGNAVWVSRGDGSGTHSKEKRLWTAAGFNSTELSKLPWYLERGAGMTDTLKMADEKGGYTLADLASYLNNMKTGNINMKIVVEASKDLLNVYAVIANNPQKTNLTASNFDASMKYIEYVVSDEGQQLFAEFGVSTFGKALFSPYIPLVTTGSNATLTTWIQDYAYFNGSECPAEYRYQAGDLYK